MIGQEWLIIHGVKICCKYLKLLTFPKKYSTDHLFISCSLVVNISSKTLRKFSPRISLISFLVYPRAMSSIVKFGSLLVYSRPLAKVVIEFPLARYPLGIHTGDHHIFCIVYPVRANDRLL